MDEASLIKIIIGALKECDSVGFRNFGDDPISPQIVVTLSKMVDDKAFDSSIVIDLRLMEMCAATYDVFVSDHVEVALARLRDKTNQGDQHAKPKTTAN